MLYFYWIKNPIKLTIWLNKLIINQMMLLFLWMRGKAKDFILKKVMFWASKHFSGDKFNFLLIIASFCKFCYGSCVCKTNFAEVCSFLGDICNYFIFLEVERVWDKVWSCLLGNISRMLVRCIPVFAVKFLFYIIIFYLFGSLLLYKFRRWTGLSWVPFFGESSKKPKKDVFSGEMLFLYDSAFLQLFKRQSSSVSKTYFVKEFLLLID